MVNSLIKRLGSVLAVSVIAVSVAAQPLMAVRPVVDLGTSVVSTNPQDNTPIVPGGWNDPITEQYEVNTFASLDGVMYAGGKFPLVQSADGQTDYLRKNIFAFNPNTGQVLPFAPNIGGQVESILAYNGALYVAGNFTTVNGATTGSLVKIDPTTGQVDPAFNPAPNGGVSDLDIAYDSLVITGKFTTVGGVTRTGLANVSFTSGSLLSNINPNITGTLTSGNTTCTTGGYRMAINGQRTRLVVAGCFTKINGSAREQIAVLNLNLTGAVLSAWKSTQTLGNMCEGSSNAAAVEDLDFEPTGQYFFGAAGGGNRPDLCDSVFKYDSAGTGANIAATWIRKTNGDTVRAVLATTNYVYFAGHQRVMINGAGTSFDRPGIGALTTTGGAVSAWNPGKGREIGSRVLYATSPVSDPGFPAGLWVGSDSGQCGYLAGETLSHEGICFFPAQN